MQSNGLLVENVKILLGGGPVLLNTAGLAGVYADMKEYGRLAIILGLAPASGTDTSAITLLQATAIAGTGAKALGFTKMWKCGAPGTSDALVQTAVASNTFSTSALAALELYVIEVDQNDLDVANGFTCVALAATDPGAVSTPCMVVMIGYQARYKAATPPSAVV